MKEKLGSLKTRDGEDLVDDREVVVKINRHFMSVFTDESIVNVPKGDEMYRGI